MIEKSQQQYKIVVEVNFTTKIKYKLRCKVKKSKEWQPDGQFINDFLNLILNETRVNFWRSTWNYIPTQRSNLHEWIEAVCYFRNEAYNFQSSVFISRISLTAQALHAVANYIIRHILKNPEFKYYLEKLESDMKYLQNQYYNSCDSNNSPREFEKIMEKLVYLGFKCDRIRNDPKLMNDKNYLDYSCESFYKDNLERRLKVPFEFYVRNSKIIGELKVGSRRDLTPTYFPT